ncbi:hypothetical protein JCM10207_004724 [Rhodosporidiobolus poonsookiae]
MENTDQHLPTPEVPPVPGQLPSQASDPQQVWGGGGGGAAASEAGSARTTSSEYRQRAMQHSARIAADERYSRFLEQEERYAAEARAEIEAADAESAARAGANEVPPPTGTGDAADLEVLECKRRLLTDEIGIPPHSPVFLPRRTTPGAEHEHHPPQTPPPQFADVAFKKLAPPKPWTGIFSHRKREDWIASAQGFLASHGVYHDSWVTETTTPSTWYAIRSLFSTDTRLSSLSPLSWFAGWNRQHEVFQVIALWNAMRTQWPDFQAAETAFRRYRNATQGNMKVVEFGAQLQALAADCYDHVITDDDLKSTFFLGLKPAARDYLRGVQAAQRATASFTMTPIKYTFHTYLTLAASFDELEGPASGRSGSGGDRVSSSSSSSRKSSSANLVPPSLSAPPSSPLQVKSWLEAARRFQAENPMSAKANWFKADARVMRTPIRCWNCCKMGTHQSIACPNKRKDPGTIVISPLRAKSSSVSPLSPSPAPRAGPAAVSESESENSDDKQA